MQAVGVGDMSRAGSQKLLIWDVSRGLFEKILYFGNVSCGVGNDLVHSGVVKAEWTAWYRRCICPKKVLSAGEIRISMCLV